MFNAVPSDAVTVGNKVSAYLFAVVGPPEAVFNPI